MRIRTRQLACLLVLLSTLGLHAPASEAQPCGFRATAIEALLFRHAVSNRATEEAEPSAEVPARSASHNTLAASDRRSITVAWTMTPANAQTAAIHAVQSAPDRAL